MAITEERSDGFENVITGLGTLARDVQMSTRWQPSEPLDDATLDSIYEGSGTSAVVIDSYPTHAFRRGILGPAKATADALHVVARVERAFKLARLFGGAAIVLVTDDVDTPSHLPPAPGSRVIELRVFDRRRVRPKTATSDVAHAELLSISPLRGKTQAVHRSRVVLVRGVETTDTVRLRRQGWDSSVLDRLMATIRSYENAHLAAGALLHKASESVLTLKNLIQMVTSNKGLLENRAAGLRLGMGLTGIILLDADAGESYTKVETSLAGLPEAVTRFLAKLASESGIPAQILSGESPTGLNATGDAAITQWDDAVAAWRERHADPVLRDLFGRICPEASDFYWPPFRETPPKAAAETSKIVAETDAIYIASGVFGADEIAAARDGVNGITRAVDPSFAGDLAPGVTADDEDEIAASTPTTKQSIAAHLTALSLPACVHGKKNRCPTCGVERDHRYDPVTATWGGDWVALP